MSASAQCIVLLAVAFFALETAQALAQTQTAQTAPTSAQWRQQLAQRDTAWNLRPHRREGPLRYENIGDDEVQEIQSAATAIVPGAVVNLSGVVNGCPCEDGLACTEQLWVVAYLPQKSVGLMLSRLDGHWGIGPVQQWWLDYAAALKSTPNYEGLSAGALRGRDGAAADRLQALYDKLPQCPDLQANADGVLRPVP